ncbi:MAG: ferredoxin family protein [Rhizomicrobium sp.]
MIAAPCIADYSCVEVCPVDCIHPGPTDEGFDDAEQMFINPDVCVNCGACVDVCPVLAIFEEGCLPAKWRHYAKINRRYFEAR